MGAIATKKIAFATGSRADYGIVRQYLKSLSNNKSISLSLLLTGALLDKRFGNEYEIIKDDGLPIAAEIPLPIDVSSRYGPIRSMSVALDAFGRYFENNRYDLIIILGDRYEMLSVAEAAAMERIPILHIHGGEATYGNVDEFIRHSITKMSLFHFTSTEIYRRRVIQLGESPDRVFNLGALGAENCLTIDSSNIPSSIIDFANKGPYFVVLFHPETLTDISEEDQSDVIASSLAHLPQFNYFLIGSNADFHSDIITKRFLEFAENNPNACFSSNLHPDSYHYLVKHSLGLIGNSSSGLIEAPSLGAYTINIGHRQDGRVFGNSVINIECDRKKLVSTIKEVSLFSRTTQFINPYFKDNSLSLYVNTTLELLANINSYSLAKKFFDVPKNRTP